MIPKEKAKQLIKKYKFYVNPYVGSGMLSNTHDDDAILMRAKDCALILIVEILEGLDTIDPITDSLQEEEKYWNEVKEEINKL